MTQTSSGGSTVKAEQRRPGRGYALVLLTSLALGVVGIVPFVLAGYAVEQLLLAPLDLAPVDSTNNDGTGVLVVCGVVAPLLVMAGWAALTATVVRRCSLRRHSWALAVAALAAPTLAFVASKVN
ncbi:MAG: hypothetical protein EON55_09625 [Alphaproteobacteria bacterium]|nr:MAG: hypothetical protein EON55_09625 [Alphaproteobacteria bacterium]